MEETDWRRIRELYVTLQAILDSNAIRIGLAVAEYFVEGIDRALIVLSAIGNDALASEQAQRDTLLGWMFRRQGDAKRADECFRNALSRSIHEVQRIAITRLANTGELDP